MTITLSSSANAAIDQMFSALEGILKKGAAAAKAKDVEDSVYLNWRLAPDMFPLAFQIRVATEFPARTLSRLAGKEPPGLADDETTFAEFVQRIATTRDIIKTLPADAIDADPDGSITFPVGPDNEMTLPRRAYVQNFILPNLYFHVTAVYLILRHLGVDLGKSDFLAAAQA